MQAINHLKVLRHDGIKRIELLSGDVTRIPPEHAVDVLVVSASPNDYWPTLASLADAFARQGVDIAALAQDPEVDLTRGFGCWLSRPLAVAGERLNVKRILCFEPGHPRRESELVGHIFRSLAPFTLAEPHLTSVALPILATGDQIEPIWDIMESLLDASFQWLKRGFPLETIKLIVPEGVTQEPARLLFAIHSEGLWEQNDFSAGGSRDRNADGIRTLTVGADGPTPTTWNTPLPPVAPAHYEFDVFVSYSHKDQEAARHLDRCLRSAGLRVFVDRPEVSIGVAWQQKIWDALGSCNRVAVLYSPDFVLSDSCKEEFTFAWIRARNLKRDVLFPLLIVEAELPVYMTMLNCADCRINDKPKVEAAAALLVARLKGAGP